LAVRDFDREELMKNHYVYRITNMTENKHYYGCRSTSLRPEQDICKLYKSSSSDQDFMQAQEDRPEDFKYKVIKNYDDRKKAIRLEIKLHNYFDVAVNKSFYNKAKQTSTGFDTTGIKLPNVSESNKNRILSEESRNKISQAHKGKKITEETRKNMSIAQSGRELTEETRKRISESKKNPSDETRKIMSIIASNRIHSKESRRKRSITSRDGANGNASPCVVYGVRYSCKKEAFTSLGINIYTLNKILTEKNL
jgi:hypothetical protein